MTREHAVLESRHAGRREIGEPDGVVGSDGQPSELDDGRPEREGANAAVSGHPRNRAAGRIREPDSAGGIDVEPERFEILCALGDALDTAVAKHAERVRHLDREPHRAVRRNRDRRGDVGSLQHSMLDERRVAPRSPHEGDADGDADDDGRNQPHAPTYGSRDRHWHRQRIGAARRCRHSRQTAAVPRTPTRMTNATAPSRLARSRRCHTPTPSAARRHSSEYGVTENPA